MKLSEMIPWEEVKRRHLDSLPPRLRARWSRECRKARDRYRSEIREYRGIPRLRRMYGRKRFRRW